jgi:CRP-like cAMP-binding protein
MHVNKKFCTFRQLNPKPIPMPDYLPLKRVLNANKKLTPAQVNYICRHFSFKHLKAFEHFQQSNEPVKYVGFITKGVIRAYIAHHECDEVTKFFLQPNQFMVDVSGLKQESASYLSFQAMSSCRLLVIPVEKVYHLCEKIPALDKIIDNLCIHYLLLINQTNDFFSKGVLLQKYQHFLELYSGVAGQIPQKYVAQFLDATPSSLSRIRREQALFLVI